MNNKTNTKTIMYFVLLILLTSSVSAQTIDLSDDKQPNQDLIDKINQYEIVKEIAKEYDAIAVTIDDYSVVLVFDNNSLTKIEDNTNQVVDFTINLDRDDIIYLLDNYQSMTRFDKIKFLIKSDMPFEHALKLSGIAMGVRI